MGNSISSTSSFLGAPDGARDILNNDRSAGEANPPLPSKAPHVLAGLAPLPRARGTHWNPQFLTQVDGDMSIVHATDSSELSSPARSPRSGRFGNDKKSVVCEAKARQDGSIGESPPDANSSGAGAMDRVHETDMREAIARSLQERAFAVLLQPAPQENQNRTGLAQGRAADPSAAGGEKPPSEVPGNQRDVQRLAYAGPNKAFRAHLEKHNLQVKENTGEGNSCAIYALVQQVKPDLTLSELENEVSELRSLYDKERPEDKGRMLYLDNGNGGAAPTLIRLVNKRWGVNIQVGVVEAGIEDAFPVTDKGRYSAPGTNAPFTRAIA